MDFKDIKTWGVLLSIIIAIGGGFSTFGSISNRLEVVENRSSVDIKPLELEISQLKARVLLLEAKVSEMQLKNNNPLMSN
tara:strand:- start:506 stop:745 length:240 start_codon:yes stop_codon:yes gene_type:complete